MTQAFSQGNRRHEEKEYLKRFYDLQLRCQSENMRGIKNLELMDEANQLADKCRLPQPYPERKAQKPEVAEKDAIKAIKQLQDSLIKRKYEIQGNEANIDSMKEFHAIHRKLNAIDEFLDALTRKE